MGHLINCIGCLICRFVIGKMNNEWIVVRKGGSVQVIKVYSKNAYERFYKGRV